MKKYWHNHHEPCNYLKKNKVVPINTTPTTNVKIKRKKRTKWMKLLYLIFK